MIVLLLVCACIATGKTKQNLPEEGCQKSDWFFVVQQGVRWIFCVSAWTLTLLSKN